MTSITVQDLTLLGQAVQETLNPFQSYCWQTLHEVRIIHCSSSDDNSSIDDDSSRDDDSGSGNDGDATRPIQQLICIGDYYVLSAFFCVCSRLLKIAARARGTIKGPTCRLLKVLLTEAWHAFPEYSNTRGKKPAQLPTFQSPAMHHLAQLLCSDCLVDHMRLQVFLFAEVMAQYGAADELQWLIEQPCWTPCRPTGLLEVQLAQTALVGVNTASVRLVHSETSDTALAALRVVEMLKQESLKGDFCLADVMCDMATRAQETASPGAKRYLGICMRACVGVWSRETHAQFPQRFRETVRVLLCMRQRDAETWGVLTKDEVDEVCKALAFPVSAWMQ